MSLTRRELFEVWRQEKSLQQKNLSVLKFVYSQLGVEESSDNEEYNISIRKNVNVFNSKVSQLWKECKRTLKVFENRHHQWLDENIELLNDININQKNATNLKRGRPPKSFSEVTDQTKRQKILSLLENYSPEELVFATRKSLEACGKRDAAKIVQEASTSSPKRATKIKKAYYSQHPVLIKYTPEEVLALYVDGNFTKKSYIMMQQGAKARNANIYPNYNIILEEKKKCYPNKNAISITDISAEIHLQELVDHTARRIIQVQSDVITQFFNEVSNGVTLLYKWGGDGSASQSNYKQKFSGEGTSEPKSDSNLFATCLVPLRLSTNTGRILWQNPRPSSTRYCRPIKLIFKKETNKLVKEEIQNIQNQISEIQPTICGLDNEQVVVNHNFNLTMIDGKTFGVVSDSSNQSCGICGATPKIMNQLEKIWSIQPKSQLYAHGISNLHAWIRCLECCLHISYRLDIKKWQIREEDEKKQVKERKQRLIENLKSQMSLLVDIPKQGFGTTNDGNTARKFFREYALSSSITGLNEEFLKRLYTILTTLSCGYMVNHKAFAEYARGTAKLYVELYSWYNMPSSLHRILIHGPEIVKAATLPIGMFSEEALESRNKEFRKYRQCNTRKFSREKTMQDLINALLVSSDPVISSLSQRIGTRSHKPTLNKEVLELLQEPDLEKSLKNLSDIEDEMSD